MEYELIDAGPCRKKMLLKFTVADVDEAFDASYKEINEYVKIKGFRKGKAPRRALANRFAGEAASGARQQLTEKHMHEVVEKEKLQILGDITSPNKNALPAEGQPFTIDAEFDVAPEFELPDYKNVKVAVEPAEVGDDKVDEAIERYRKMFANYEAADGPAEVGDVLRVGFKTMVDGEEIMAMDDQRLRVEGEILFGLPCPDLVQKFTGAKKDDLVEVAVTLPQDHANPDLRGREANVEVTVKGVERGTLPELDDAFAQGIGMNTMQDFRERIKSNLVREAFIAAKQKEEDEIIDKLLAETSFEVPQGMVDSETNALVEQQRMHLLRSGAKQGDAMNAQLEKYRPEAAKQAERKVRWTIMSQKIGEKEGIKVTNEDMNAQIEALAQNYNTTPAKIVQRIREFDGFAPMMAEILSIKVIQFISGGKTISAETGDVNAEAAQIGSDHEHGHDHDCGCGHDHGHDHAHGADCGCGHDH